MNQKAGLYGLSSDERHRLQILWHKLKDTGSQELFGDFEAFAKWSAENGFAIGKLLIAKDIRSPRGPENAYWHPHDIPQTDAQRAALVTLTEHPCISCPRCYYCDTACYLRKKWWDMGMEKLRERFYV